MSSHPVEYSADERRWLLRLAQTSIRAAVTDQPPPRVEASDHLRELRGAFVTLHKKGKLRGCIGVVVAMKPLDETVREMAAVAALDDPRFDPVTEDELDKLQVEISVLSPMYEIAPDDVVVGRDGLVVSYGGHRGLLLPQVAVQWGWEREMFLAQTCLKAGLPPDQWRHGARLEAFTAEVFGENEPGESLRE
jgi:AmmeMemoRadiSam system protein A